jgi:pimeloyl-ACP methyl ester carboxylesterase
MKTKLLLTLMLFGMLTISNAQISIPIVKQTQFEKKTNDFFNQNKNTQAVQNLPYPIIFIHGLNSISDVWYDLGLQLVNSGLTVGGRIDFCLNYNGSNTISNKLVYPTPNADIALYTDYISNLYVGDFYFLNFDVDNFGRVRGDTGFSDVLSNESAIAKQGVALNIAIQIVLQKTGKDKVIIMGHSMGGLCGREYLQNPSIWIEPNVNHHVAKLITTGTPHGGYTGTNVPGTGIDSRSEAYRDLRKEYTWSGSVGAYLYGGIENQTNIDNSVFSDFYNVDVNCNGINGDNSMIVGLNDKTWINNLDYSYIVGVCTNCDALQGLLYPGDGIVRSENANLSNFTNQLPAPINEFIYQAAQTGVIGLHSELPQAIPVNFRGLDEPNEYNVAYGVEFGKTYKGFITQQPANGYPYDYDDYKFSVTSNSQVSVLINNTFSNPIYARIINSNNFLVGQELTVNIGSNTLTLNLSAGLYYLEIYTTATSTSYLYPYTFSLSSTLSNPDFTSADSIKIYPNPTSSKVFFDNSIEKFETATIINYLGQVVDETRFSSFEANQEVDLSSFTSGVYLVKFTNKDKSITHKIIKE